jgi:hypothetical protein
MRTRRSPRNQERLWRHLRCVTKPEPVKRTPLPPRRKAPKGDATTTCRACGITVKIADMTLDWKCESC